MTKSQVALELFGRHNVTGPILGQKGYMDIGWSDKPHIRILDDEGSLLIHEDTEMCTYTLYQIEDTVLHPKPSAAKKYMEMPYTFDALTGVMRIYKLVGVDNATEEGLENLLGKVVKV